MHIMHDANIRTLVELTKNNFQNRDYFAPIFTLRKSNVFIAFVLSPLTLGCVKCRIWS